MSRDEIRATVLAALQEIQEVSGRVWCDLSDEMKPLGALQGFDSLSGIEATICIEQRLGRELAAETVFVSKDSNRPLTLSEVCDQVAQCFSVGQRT
jgi:hypothetical protein